MSLTAERRAVVTGAHLVGSVNLPTAEAVISTVAEHLGDHVTRIPDGEVGERYYWIQFQTLRLERDARPRARRRHPVPDPRRVRPAAVRARRLRRRGGPAVPRPRLRGCGHRLVRDLRARCRRRAGSPPDVRFQVSLPTPAAVVGAFIAPQDRAAVEPVYARALFAELDRIAGRRPARPPRDPVGHRGRVRLARARGARRRRLAPWCDDVLGGVLERAARAGGRRAGGRGGRLPPLLRRRRGDALRAAEGRRHARLRRARAARGARRGRSTGSTCRCRSSATTPPTSRRWRTSSCRRAPRSCLGLVHHEDGVEGALRRIDAASTAVPASASPRSAASAAAPPSAPRRCSTCTGRSSNEPVDQGILTSGRYLPILRACHGERQGPCSRSRSTSWRSGRG